MKIAIYIDDIGYRRVDISHPQNGNPGIGGTEYCFATFIYAIAKYTNLWIELYHTSNNIFLLYDYEQYVNTIDGAINLCKERYT